MFQLCPGGEGQDFVVSPRSFWGDVSWDPNPPHCPFQKFLSKKPSEGRFMGSKNPPHFPFYGLIPHSLLPSFSLETTYFKQGLAHFLKRRIPEENGEGTKSSFAQRWRQDFRHPARALLKFPPKAVADLGSFDAPGSPNRPRAGG